MDGQKNFKLDGDKKLKSFIIERRMIKHPYSHITYINKVIAMKKKWLKELIKDDNGIDHYDSDWIYY